MIDIHVHSTLKPFSNTLERADLLVNDPNDKASLWYEDYPDEKEQSTLIEYILGVPRYRQSDFNTIVNAQIKIVFVSLYPVEKGMVLFNRDTIPAKVLKKYDDKIVAGTSLIPSEKTEFIKHGKAGIPYNYFEELNKEYQYLLVNQGTRDRTNQYDYKILDKTQSFTNSRTLFVIPTIEGAHCFCNGSNPDNIAEWDGVEDRIITVKRWQFPPLFITFGHHFYNGLCTHPKSLFEVDVLLDQSHGMRSTFTENNETGDGIPPITDTGYRVLKTMLSDTNGKRILVDVKHMSVKARKAFYQFLKVHYPGENIPIVYSHGAVASLHDYPTDAQKDEFYCNPINLVLADDIINIYESDGLIGIEMDQRILNYNHNRFFKTFFNIFRRKSTIAFNEAAYVWHQIITIAEFAYTNGYKEDPWKCIAIGSDYDGIINPLNEYKTVHHMKDLIDNLFIYLDNYWNSSKATIPKNCGGTTSEVIEKIKFNNAFRFLENNYNNV